MNFTRSKFGKVYVHIYNRETKRGEFLPRSETRHLDSLSDEEIWKWMHECFGEKAASVSNLSCPTPPDLGPSVIPPEVLHNFERWLAFLKDRKLDRLTIKQHRSYTTRFVFEFFGRVVKEPDPVKWPNYAGRFYNWLVTVGNIRAVRDENNRAKLDEAGNPSFIAGPCSPPQIRAANIAFRKFYTWMIEEGIVPAVEFKLRPPVGLGADVQLPRPVEPKEVLEWSRRCTNPVVKFIGLVGYFFSLRPQEVFALRPQDFRTGEEIGQLECVKVMKENQLFGKLAVYIGRQKQNTGRIKNGAKKASNGWVACFNEEGAREIVTLLTQFSPEAVVAHWNNKKLYDDWRELGVKGLAPKDLRRSSLYWLGHYTKIHPLQLMKHARHRNVETTMIYCQRPEELGPQDLSRDSFELTLD